MGGFLVGTLALIVLEVTTQDKAAERLGTVGKIVQSGLGRLLSPTVAGVPQRKSK